MRPPDGFEPIDWTAPLDVEAIVASVPPDAQIRGMFTDQVCKLAAKSGRSIGRDRYIGFKYYPLSEHIELLAQATAILHPDLPLREGLRRLGAHAAPTLKDSMIGKVFSSFVGDQPAGMLSLVGKSYTATRSMGTARVTDTEAGKSTIITLRTVHDFPDCLHPGIFEAVMRENGLDWELRVRRHSSCDVDVWIGLRSELS